MISCYVQTNIQGSQFSIMRYSGSTDGNIMNILSIVDGRSCRVCAGYMIIIDIFLLLQEAVVTLMTMVMVAFH